MQCKSAQECINPSTFPHSPFIITSEDGRRIANVFFFREGAIRSVQCCNPVPCSNESWSDLEMPGGCSSVVAFKRGDFDLYIFELGVEALCRIA